MRKIFCSVVCCPNCLSAILDNLVTIQREMEVEASQDQDQDPTAEEGGAAPPESVTPTITSAGPSGRSDPSGATQEEDVKDTLATIKRIANELFNGEVKDINSAIEQLKFSEGRGGEGDASMNGPTPSAPPQPDTITQHETENTNIRYISYESELQMPSIMKLIQKDLSEPYSIYTYRYFIHNWPKLCFLAIDTDRDNMVVGAIVCKLDVHKQSNRRGYIAMLAVDEGYRRKKIGSSLVLRSIRAMVHEDADEIVLETEITNKSALRLYENLGFVRDKRLFRYYLNGVDALRLKLWLK